MTVDEAAAMDVSVAQDGGVMKVVKRAGPDPDDKPWKGDRVTVHYTGTLEADGSKFDSSVDRGDKFQFNLGKQEVIKGWDMGVATMVRGEVAVFTIKSNYAYGDMGSPPKIPGGATLVFEVELFDFSGEDITKDKDKGITKRIKVEGEGFDHPNDGGMATIDYVAYHGKRQFDSAQDLSFVIGEGQDHNLPIGLERALEKMKRGEKAYIQVSSGQYNFGKAGCPKFEIPGGDSTVLSYDVYLKSFERAKESWQLVGDQKLEQARIYKEKGTVFFKAAKVEMAANKYRKVIDLLEHEISLKDEKEEERKVLLQAGRLNLAMCKLKGGEWIEARDLCSKVLDENTGAEGGKAKAFFRRGEAQIQLKDYALARDDFRQCLELDPENKAAKNKVTVCNQLIKSQKDKEKRMYAKMFDKFAEIDAKKEREKQKAQKPLEINEWSTNANGGQGQGHSMMDSLKVTGDVEMNLDLDAELKKQEDKDKAAAAAEEAAAEAEAASSSS